MLSHLKYFIVALMYSLVLLSFLQKMIANQVYNYCAELSSVPDKQTIDLKVFDTAIWLRDQGYLVDSGSADSGFSFVLSERGLHALNLKPSSLCGEESFRDRISQGISGISVGIVSGLMVEFFK